MQATTNLLRKNICIGQKGVDEEAQFHVVFHEITPGHSTAKCHGEISSKSLGGIIFFVSDRFFSITTTHRFPQEILGFVPIIGAI